MTDYGFLAQDDSSHWYLVPEGEISEFNRLLDIIDDEDARDVFIERYDKFRLSGGPENLKIPLSVIGQ